MSNFNEREQAFENRFAFDAEKAFKARTRRNSRLAEWAADQMGYESDARAEYVDAVGKEFLQKEIADLVAYIQAGFEKESISVSDVEIFKKAEELLNQAYQEVSEGV